MCIEKSIGIAVMSKHMNAKYKRDARKRAKDQQGGDLPKQPRTNAEYVRRHRANLKAARGKASSTTGWDAGEGPSSRGRRIRTTFLNLFNSKC